MNRKVNYIFPQKITWFVPVFDLKKKKTNPKMSKFKSRLLPYSPSQNMTPMETSLESPGEEPDSPVSSASLIFDGVQWQLPLSQSDMEVENFHRMQLLGKNGCGHTLFCCSCGNLLVYNKCIHNGCIDQEPNQVLPCLVSKAPYNILHSHLIMSIHTIHVLIVQVHIFWLIHMQFHGLFYD